LSKENCVPISVFLIEDMKPLRSALAELLVNRGDFAIAGMADTEAEANLWFEEHVGKWDLIIVDLILAQGTGMRVIPKAREKSVDGRIVVFSDFATTGIQTHCIKLGADAVFDKFSGTAGLLDYCVTLFEPKTPSH
jgi:DNA-binding NarL/FixJ family response regulator